ncbi:MAG: chitobiase/beta-hexosaminidase C-terminal domain-containing protein [Janthinobacterium lividum]
MPHFRKAFELVFVLLLVPVTLPCSAQSRAGADGGSKTMSSMALGVDRTWGGYYPGAASDVLRQNISGAPLSTLNDAFQTQYGNLRLDMDSSVYLNVVNSKTQHVTWTSVALEGFPIMQVPLVGNELLEGNSAGSRTPFTCWKDNGDGHLLLADIGTGIFYDFYNFKTCNGRAEAYSGYAYDASKALDTQNGYGLDSTTAAGTAFTPGLLRYEEAAAGTIDHATRFTMPNVSRFFSANGMCFYGVVTPATHGSRDHCAGNPAVAPVALAYGQRLRLKASVSTAGYSPEIRNILNGWKTYGIEMDDTNGPGRSYATLLADSRWDVDHLAEVKKHITLGSFEVVQVNGENPVTVDTEDDANGADSKRYSYTQTPKSGGGFTPSQTLLRNPHNRPTIKASSCSSGTIALGSSVTCTLAVANAVDGAASHYFDNAPPLTGDSVTISPTQNTVLTPYARGRYGIVKGKPIRITVTGPTVATPVFSLPTGTYRSVQTVAVTSATTGGAIHITRDGSLPSCFSPVYSKPYTLTGPETDKAIGCKANLLDSAVTTAEYVIAIPGGVPVVVSHNSSGAEYVAPPLHVSFTAGNAAIIGIVKKSFDAGVVPIRCGTKTANRLQHVNMNATAPAWSYELYLIPSVDGGAQTCSFNYKAADIPYLEVTQVQGTSGVDAIATGSGNAPDNAGAINCGKLITTGPNRLLYVLGGHPGAGARVMRDYTTMFHDGNIVVGRSAVASASTKQMEIASEYRDNSGCISLALKP